MQREARRPWYGRATCVAMAVLMLPVSSAAQTPALESASLEELMGIRVTSAGRKSQRAEDVAAAIYVITREQIAQSGLRTLPEILRLAPGVQVARAGSNKWAVSVRGFNDVYSNKLLILVDGRSVYSRSFSGVFWEAQDLVVDEIARIEVIRGPGGALWGANAVTGVLNIITRHASESAGGAVEVSAGGFDQARVTARYGGALGAIAYRVSSQWSSYGNALSLAGTSAGDRWASAFAGIRADWAGGADAVMVTAHVNAGRSRPRWLVMTSLAPAAFGVDDGVTRASDVSVAARWTRDLDSGAVLQLQGTHGRTNRDEATLSAIEQSSGADLQLETRLGGRHAIVAGGGYQFVHFDPYAASLTLSIGDERAHVVNAFVSDEITLAASVKATVGAKVEHDSVTGTGVLPSARAIWTVSEHHRVWASIARARRTPALTDRTLRYYFGAVPGPQGDVVLAFVGNPSFRSETLTQASVGYRAHAGTSASLEIVGFYGDYAGLATTEPIAPVLATVPSPAHVVAALHNENLLDVTTRGIEVNGDWTPHPAWRLYGSWSWLDLTPRVRAMSLDTQARTSDGNAPRVQWQAHASHNPTSALRLDASVYRVGALRQLGLPAYTRADARVEQQLGPRLAVSVVGQNLLDRSHIEFSGITLPTHAIPRSWHAQLRWSF